VWAMVKRGRIPNLSDDQARRVYFPFAKSPGHFRYLVGSRLPGCRRADIAMVRRYQPYQRRIFRETLGALDVVSNDDKHRTVQPVFALPESAQFKIANPRDCVPGRIAPPRGHTSALNVGTELAYVYVRKTGPNPEIDVEGEIGANIAIHDWVRLDRWSSVTFQVVSDLLFWLAEPPFPRKGIPDWAIARHRAERG